MSFPEFLLERRGELIALTGQHLALVAVSTLLAVAIGIPLGLLASRRRATAKAVLGAANLLQTIPSLALFGILIPVPLLGGIGAKTAIVALVVYSLLPIIRGACTGMAGIPAPILEAATGMGMTPRQLLWMVELPLALPVIMSGIRVATVVSVGLATIAAAIGAGGLGTLIFRGVAMVDNRLILAGALPAAALALAADWALGRLEAALTPGRRR